MYASNSGYDRGVNTFSPEGRLFQVEYAMKAIQLGSTAIGIKTTEGIVLAVEKRVQSGLMEASSVSSRSFCATLVPGFAPWVCALESRPPEFDLGVVLG